TLIDSRNAETDFVGTDGHNNRAKRRQGRCGCACAERIGRKCQFLSSESSIPRIIDNRNRTESWILREVPRHELEEVSTLRADVTQAQTRLRKKLTLEGEIPLMRFGHLQVGI